MSNRQKPTQKPKTQKPTALVVIIPADDRATQDRALSANKDAFKYFLTKGRADKLRKMLLFGLDEYERKHGDTPEQF